MRLSVVCVHIFCFFFSEEKIWLKKEQLVQDIIPPLCIYIHMCVLRTHIRIYVCRDLVHLHSSGPTLIFLTCGGCKSILLKVFMFDFQCFQIVQPVRTSKYKLFSDLRSPLVEISQFFHFHFSLFHNSLFHFCSIFSIFPTCSGRKSRKTAACDGSCFKTLARTCGRRKSTFWKKLD